MDGPSRSLRMLYHVPRPQSQIGAANRALLDGTGPRMMAGGRRGVCPAGPDASRDPAFRTEER